MSDLAETADVVVVGDGSAGAVLAARFTQDPGRTTLLLEAGLLRSGVGAADELTALGIGVVADLPVDPRFTPLFDELQRRAAVVFVHPNPSPDPSAHSLGLPDTLIDFTADTTRAIAQLQYSNTLARTPDVKYIFAHAGGTVPYLAGRFGIIDEMRVIPEPRAARPRPRHSAACTGIQRRPGATPCCAYCATSWESTPSYSAPTTPTCAAT